MGEERTFGLASAADFAALSGIELLQRVIDGKVPAPPMGKTLGFRLVRVDPGFAFFEADPGPHLLNPLGSVHGGFALALIDSAAGCAVHTTLPAGLGYTTVETKVNFTSAIRPDAGRLTAEGRVIAQGRQIATAEGRLLAPDGKILAHGTSTLMILHPRS